MKDDILRGGETILLVDDEELIIDVGKQMMDRLGYTVYTAINGGEALNYYKIRPTDIDLVILDIRMPDMDGKAVYEKLKKINPNVKVLLSSGYSIDGLVTEILLLGCDGFIQKPFNLKRLSLEIRNVLDKENAGRAECKFQMVS